MSILARGSLAAALSSRPGDLRAIELGALSTVDQTVRPAHVGLWIRRETYA